MNLSEFTISEFLQLLKKNKRLYLKVIGATFILSVIYSFSIPKEYTASTKLAPEFSPGNGLGNLGGLASMAGLDLSKMSAEEDALFPDLYPEIISSTEFINNLLSMQVTTIDGELTTDLKDYLVNYQSEAWWKAGIMALGKLLPKKEKIAPVGVESEDGPILYSEEDLLLMKGVSEFVNLKQELKTGIITITATVQDPLIAALVVDSVSSQLQNYIFNYRTHKASVDLAYAEKICADTKAEYEAATQAYAQFADRHFNTIKESASTQRDYLRNEMELKFQLYTQYSQQAAMAKARLQARTPVYNIIQPPVVPVRKSAPRRMVIVLLWEIIVFCGMSVWLVLKDKSLTANDPV
ncbi:MAG: chain-length determining protein [Bacteroidaceae bacterium]|nr:chain-length determining protein [Bacteroidaceae bacterium]